MVRSSTPSFECTNSRYEHIEVLATMLSEDLMATSKHYKIHSWGGIFAQGSGGRSSAATKRMEANAFDYKQVKSRFIFNHLCHAAARKPIRTICEVGFMAGHTAMLFAETVPTAKVVSFDLGDAGLVPWLAKQNNRLKEAYGERWLGVIKGSSMITVPRYHLAHPDFACDAVFVDGGKTTELRYHDYVNLRNMSSPHALVFFDEATALGCVNGSYSSMGDCYYTPTGKRIHDTSTVKSAMGTWRASRAGVIRVRACEWAPGYEESDGVCVARFVPPRHR